MVERAVALADQDVLCDKDFFPDPDSGSKYGALPMGDLKASAIAAEKKRIRQVLAQTGNSMARAAAILGISRKTLWEKIRRYGIESPQIERNDEQSAT